MKEVLSELQEVAIKDERTSRFTSTKYVSRVNIFKSFHVRPLVALSGSDKESIRRKITICEIVPHASQ